MVKTTFTRRASEKFHFKADQRLTSSSFVRAKFQGRRETQSFSLFILLLIGLIGLEDIFIRSFLFFFSCHNERSKANSLYSR